jgi:hypothetical protein
MRVAGVATILLSVILLACNGKNPEAAPTSILITPANPSIPYGTSIQFKAEKVLSNGNKQDITSQADWLSSDPTVTISPAGRAKSLAIGEAAAEISVSFDGQVAQATLSIKNAALASISVEPFSRCVSYNGEIWQFHAVGLFSDSSTWDITADVEWTSSDTAVATVDVAGLVTIKDLYSSAPGCYIKASSSTPLTSTVGQASVGLCYY